MKNKKSQLRRLMTIYIVFLIVLVVGFVHGFSIDFVRGFIQGTQESTEMGERWAKGEHVYRYMITSIPVKGDSETIDTHRLPKGILGIEARTERIDLTVEKSSESGSMMGAAFRIVGDNTTLYIALMIFLLSRLAVVILMAVIINSLRRSIRDELPLSSSNIWCTRVIGALLIFSEALSSLVSWIQRCHAARLIEGSGWIVDDAFRISYWNILMGILVIFTAEAFAIGQQLSEEQKFTI